MTAAVDDAGPGRTGEVSEAASRPRRAQRVRDVVLLHGWGSTASVWNGFEPRLAGYRVVSLDLPGSGAGPEAAVSTLEAMAHAVAAAAPPRCHVVGWSLGAQVAMAWARRAPHQVERLGLVAATPCFTQRADWTDAMAVETFTRFAQALAVDCDAALRRFVTLQAQGDDDARAVARRLRAALPRTDGARAAGLAGGLRVLLETDLRDVARALAAPALVLHGERDGLVPAAAAERLSRLLPAGRLHRVPGAAHAPFLSRPQAVADALRAFLDE